MTRNLHVLFALVILTAAGSGQEPRRLPLDTLAWVDGQPILARELRARVELMPWPGTLRPSNVDSVKVHALSALIAERLLATEATLRGLHDLPPYRRLRWGLTRALLRDALFQTEVAGRLEPTIEELREALRRYEEERMVLVVLTATSEAADSIAVEFQRSGLVPRHDERILDRDTVVVTFGMSDTLFERLAYEIGPPKVSPPRRMERDRWIVLLLLTQRPNPLATKQDADERRRAVGKILQQRLDARAGEQFYRSTLAAREAASDPDAFQKLADLITEIWSEDSTRFRRTVGYELSSEMVDLLHARLGASDGKELVSMEGRGMTIGEVVEMFRYEPWISAEPQGIRFLNRLNERIRFVVAGEYLARLAQDRRLDLSPEMQRELRSWTEYWAAGEMVRTIRDTVRVSAADMVEILSENAGSMRGRALVSVEEVFSRDSNEAVRLHDSMLRGAPVAALSAGRTVRREGIDAEGRSGWFDPADDPVVGFHALLAGPGALAGPLSVDSGWASVRVIGVEPKDAALWRDTLMRAAGPVARARRGHEAVNTVVAELAQRRQVHVVADAVKRTSITSTPMFTRRYLGFGGWMNGAPMLMPLWEWVRQLPASANWPL